MRIAKLDETKQMYQKNLSMLTVWLKDSIEKIDEQDLWNRVKVKYNDEGYPVCVYQQDGKHFHITSRKPIEEARRWRASLPDFIGSGAIFLFGSGFGYPLFEIFAEKKPHTLVVVFEENLYLFKAMLYYFDFQPILESGKIVFLIGEPEYYANAFEELFFSIFFIGCTYPVVARTFAAQRNFKEQYKRIHKDVFVKLSLMVFYMGNDHKDNLIGFINIIANVKEIVLNSDISCIKSKYQGYPAFIVANGPSLDKSIQELKNIHGRGLIVCVESASIPMFKNQIKPDILAVIERTKASFLFHFQKTNFSNDVALLGLAVADPRIFTSFKGEKIPILREREIVNQWISAYLCNGSVIDAGANVSHLATELAIYMGADPIIFVGQDYAYGPDQSTHSKDSVYSEEIGRKAREFIQSRPMIETEGNDGRMVMSNETWLDFKKGLEIKIAQHPQNTFINTTEGGARIVGTRRERLKDVISRYCIRPIPCQVDQLMRENRIKASLPQRREGLNQLIISVKQYVHEFREFALEANKSRLECKKILSLIKKNDDGRYNKMLDEAYQKNIASFNRLIMNGMFRCFLQQLIFANYYMINRLKMIDTPDKIADVFKIHCNFFCQISAACQSVAIHFENAASLLDNLAESLDSQKDGETDQ